ncbi:MAG TPA: cytochrome c peroxidase [Chitinophagaceae bacterium]|nr:cytochrome c peroxidase [Chitinophagaceae bacterium]
MKKYWMLISACAAVVMVQSFVTFNEPANKAELGKVLFFDPILSSDSTISCASCHLPEFAFADTARVSTGVGGSKGTRNTPSAMNVLLQRSFFWDGRAASLEEQALKPIENPVEMNLPIDKAVARLQNSKTYSAWFRKIFNSEPTAKHLASAIAAFERTLETSDSPFDEWKYSEKQDAVSEAVKRGFEVFNTKGKCIQCHFGANLASNDFRNVGTFNGREFNDSGRAAVTRKPEDLGKFKIGPLRNVALTGPYMHDGSLKTLEEVIEFYNDTEQFVRNPINKDSLLAKPLGLTAQEKSDLLAFLHALTDKRFSATTSSYPHAQ